MMWMIKEALRHFAAAICALIFVNGIAGANSLIQKPVLRSYQPVRIALPDFVAESPADADLARTITQVIADDLELSGVFVRTDPATFPEKTVGVDVSPRFADWRAAGTQELVAGKTMRRPDGRTGVAFRLWDLFGESQLTGRQYSGDPTHLGDVGHMISAEIYQRVVGESRSVGSAPQ